MIRRLRAQSTLEYAVLTIIIIGAFIAMNQYIRRGFQGRWKATMDDFGEQYDPRLVNSLINYSLTVNSDTVLKIIPMTSDGKQGYYTNRIDTSHSIEEKRGFTAVGAFDDKGQPTGTEMQ